QDSATACAAEPSIAYTLVVSGICDSSRGAPAHFIQRCALLAPSRACVVGGISAAASASSPRHDAGAPAPAPQCPRTGCRIAAAASGPSSETAGRGGTADLSNTAPR